MCYDIIQMLNVSALVAHFATVHRAVSLRTKSPQELFQIMYSPSRVVCHVCSIGFMRTCIAGSYYTF